MTTSLWRGEIWTRCTQESECETSVLVPRAKEPPEPSGGPGTDPPGAVGAGDGGGVALWTPWFGLLGSDAETTLLSLYAARGEVPVPAAAGVSAAEFRLLRAQEPFNLHSPRPSHRPQDVPVTLVSGLTNTLVSLQVQTLGITGFASTHPQPARVGSSPTALPRSGPGARSEREGPGRQRTKWASRARGDGASARTSPLRCL